MSFVPLPEMRSRFEETSNGLSITIPAQRNAGMLLFHLCWLIGWAFAEISVIRELISGSIDSKQEILFILVWLSFWTVAGGFTILLFLWIAFGSEHIIVKSNSLILRKQILGLARTWEYDIAHVKRLRLTRRSIWAWGYRDFGSGGGLITFDYGARTIRFVTGVDEAEAYMIIDRLSLYGLPIAVG